MKYWNYNRENYYESSKNYDVLREFRKLEDCLTSFVDFHELPG